MIEKYSRVYANIDLDAIRFNMEQTALNIKPGTKIFGVIKSDGYGHGASPIARELEPLDCLCGFAVATLEEALILKKSGIKKTILILGYPFPYGYEEMIKEDFRVTVFEWETVRQLSACVERMNKDGKRTGNGLPDYKANVHVKVDTGMSRIGIRPDGDGLEFVKRTMHMPGIEVEGIYTHFAGADEKDKSAARRQLHVFQEFVTQIEKETGERIPLCHCSNSAGIIEMQDANMDAVRAGIMLYGLWPSQDVSQDVISLRPAMELKSQIIYIKEVEAGTPVSYGGTFVASRPTMVATIPVGYGDGYPRGLSNKGHVLVHGRRAPVIGRVCMDQFMVDITDIPGVQEGTPVTLIGKDGEERITMEQLGELSGRFNYELACLIGKRVPRIYIREGRITETKDYFQDFI